MPERTSTSVPAHVHGMNGYSNYGCRCDTCRTANADFQAAYRDRLAGTPFDEIPHGTTNGYGNYRCRCDACRAANTETRRRQRRADL